MNKLTACASQLLRHLNTASRPQLLFVGALLTGGYAPFHFWPLALFSLAFWARAVANAATPKEAFRRSLWWGMGHGLTALYWLPWAFWHDSHSLIFALTGGIPASLVAGAYFALGYALIGRLGWCFRARALPFGVAISLGVVGIELLRNLSAYGFPWLPLGAIWASPNPILAQLASVGSVQLVSWVVIATALLLSHTTPRSWLLAALLLGLNASYGTLRMEVSPSTAENAPIIRIVQPNQAETHRWIEPARWQYMEAGLRLGTMPAQHNVTPSLVVLPESALPYFLPQDDYVAEYLFSLYPATPLLIGTNRRVEHANGHATYFNTLSLIEQGMVKASHDKHILVPFGEFLPLRATLESLPLPVEVRPLSARRTDFTPGHTSAVLNTPLGGALGMICYEGIFPYFVASHTRGANWLLNVTNDIWFTGTIALPQHAALQRLRAIETGLPLVRSANTGISLLTDGYGRTLQALGPRVGGVIDAPLPPALPSTFWRKTWEFLIHR